MRPRNCFYPMFQNLQQVKVLSRNSKELSNKMLKYFLFISPLKIVLVEHLPHCSHKCISQSSRSNFLSISPFILVEHYQHWTSSLFGRLYFWIGTQFSGSDEGQVDPSAVVLLTTFALIVTKYRYINNTKISLLKPFLYIQIGHAKKH